IFRSEPSTTCTSCPMRSTSPASSDAFTPSACARANASFSNLVENACGVCASTTRSRGTVPVISATSSGKLARFTSFTVSIAGIPRIAASHRRASSITRATCSGVTNGRTASCTSTISVSFATSRKAAATESCRESPPFTTRTVCLNFSFLIRSSSRPTSSARAASAVHEAAHRAHVHDGSRPAVAGGEAPGGAVLMHRTEAERVHEHPFGGVPLVRPDGNAVKAVDRVLARNAGGRSPGGPRLGAEVADDFEHQPIVVPERDHLPGRPLVPDAVTHQPLDPESERAWQHGERCDGDLSSPVAPGSGAGPGEESHDTPRSAHVIAVVEMVCLRIVEIHGALDEPEAEQPDVEVEVALGVARDRGDVMDAEHAGHDQYSANASSG